MLTLSETYNTDTQSVTLNDVFIGVACIEADTSVTFFTDEETADLTFQSLNEANFNSIEALKTAIDSIA